MAISYCCLLFIAYRYCYCLPISLLLMTYGYGYCLLLNAMVVGCSLALWLLFISRHYSSFLPVLHTSYLYMYYPIAYPLPL